MGYKHLTLAQQVAIHDELKNHITKLPDGLCYYHDPGINDQTVADEFDVTVNQVRHVREQLFGKLHRGPVRAPVEAVDRKAREAIHKLIDILTKSDLLSEDDMEELQELDLPLE